MGNEESKSKCELLWIVLVLDDEYADYERQYYGMLQGEGEKSVMDELTEALGTKPKYGVLIDEDESYYDVEGCDNLVEDDERYDEAVERLHAKGLCCNVIEVVKRGRRYVFAW